MALDLHEVYGIDVEDKALMASRPWRWLSSRMLGLLSTECRVQRVLNPTPEQKKARSKARS